MIISVSGTPGSGKSTVAKKLAKKLSWPRYYMGKIRRLKAKSLNLTLTEYNKLAEKDPRTDIEVDEYLKQLAKDYDDFIIESRTAWHFIPNSLKIYIDVDEKVGAERVYRELINKNNRNEDKKLKTINDVLRSHRQRKLSDNKRYKKYYHINIYNKKNYDYILDTTKLTKTRVFAEVYNFVKKRLIYN